MAADPLAFDPELPSDDPLAGEVKKSGVSAEDQKKFDEDEKLRRIIGNVYTFVRSQEVTRNISGFTFDHYIAEAIRKLKGDGRAIRDAAGEVLDTKPPQIEALRTLKVDFEAMFAKAKETAKNTDVEESQAAAAIGTLTRP